MKDQIQKAMEFGAAVNVLYTNAKGETSLRTVTPIAIEDNDNGTVTIRCETDKGFRSLRLDWILEIAA